MKRITGGVCVLLLLIGCQSRAARQPIAAPDFQLKDLAGHTVSLASFRGHPVLLDFWATWCGPCRISIPMVQKFYEKHKAEGLVVLGMNVDDDRSGVYPFVKQLGMTYPIVFAADSTTSEDYRVQGIPTFVFIDSQGHVVKIYEGFRSDMIDDWEEEFQKIKATAA